MAQFDSRDPNDRVGKFVGVLMTPHEHMVSVKAAALMGLSYRGYIRMLIVNDAKQHGLWPPRQPAEVLDGQLER